MNDLNENGCIFLQSVYTKNNMNKILDEFIQFYIGNNIQEELNKREDVSKQNYYVNNTYNLLNCYEKMRYYYLPVIDNRIGHNRIVDVGVIDIFNISKLLASIHEIIEIDVLLSIINKLTNKEWKFLRMNLQINNNVKNPNQYHYMDKEIIKVSVLLNDINENTGGGISYIHGSHINKKISNNNMKNFYGSCGDVFINYQNGYHKKMQQQNSIHYFLNLFFEIKNKK